MYFSKSEFIANMEVAEAAQRDAQEAIRIGARDFDITLDGSSDSLRRVDAILDRIHAWLSASGLPKEGAEGFVRIFGSYFGEVLRREHEATWGVARSYSSQAPALCVGSTSIIIRPQILVHDRIMKGTGRDLWTYYQTLVRSLQAGEDQVANNVPPAREGKTGASPGKLYILRHDQDYFEAGTIADGRQLLMVFVSNELTAIFFDGEGNLLGYEVRLLPVEAPQETPEFEAAATQALQAWKDEIGFQPGPIRIHQFALPELEAGIEDRPDHYEEFLKAPELEEPKETIVSVATLRIFLKMAVWAATFALLRPACAQPVPTKTLLEMQPGVEKRLAPSSAQVTIAPSHSPAAPGIDVTIQPGKEEYPGVHIKPVGASWNLAAYGHVRRTSSTRERNPSFCRCASIMRAIGKTTRRTPKVCRLRRAPRKR